MRPRVSFVVDCGGEVGWGHFARSHALALELRGRGCDVHIYVNGVLPPFAPPDAAVGTGLPIGVVEAPPLPAGSDAVVLDLWRYSRSTADAVPRSALLVTLVDCIPLPFRADIVVDPNVSGSGDSTGGVRLSGRDYLILRPAFDHSRPHEARHVAGPLLVSFGGTQQGPMLEQALRALATLENRPFPHVVAVVPATVATGAARDDSAPRLSQLTSVDDMPALLRDAQAGLIAAGTLLHEACATGLPCAVVSLTAEQHAEAQAIADRGAIVYLGHSEQVTDSEMAAALRRLADADVRSTLATRARTVADGAGRRRVVDAILDGMAARMQRTGS